MAVPLDCCSAQDCIYALFDGFRTDAWKSLHFGRRGVRTDSNRDRET
jgi:hypothetical protein